MGQRRWSRNCEGQGIMGWMGPVDDGDVLRVFFAWASGHSLGYLTIHRGAGLPGIMIIWHYR